MIQFAHKKLTREEQFEVCKQVAMYKKHREVNEYLKETFGKTLTPHGYHYYRDSTEWQPIIEKYRKQYNEALLDVPIANKRKRLDELQSTYDHFKSKRKLVNAQSVLRDARDEMEPHNKFGDTFNFNQVNQTLYASMSDEELDTERLKQLEKLKHYSALAKRAAREKSNASSIGSTASPNGDSGAPPREITQGESGSPEDEPQPAA